jgi:3'-phosphoadenosine 5'-phosphosulfate sulfotransferase (PAPS reductase)/FAD synthetase
MSETYVVMYSGGIASYMAARRVILEWDIPRENVILLFTDTKIEDVDLYRFLDDTSEFFGIPVTRIADGRTPWEVFRDEKFLGNSRIDPCSRILKRELSAKWLKDHCDPQETIVCLGLDWTEEHRATPAIERYGRMGWRAKCPLCEPPYLTRWKMFSILKQDGIRVPRLYELGFDHNNCGGGCVKAGQGHFAKLLSTRPWLYEQWEANEEKLREQLGNVSILKSSIDGKSKPLTLRELRERIQSGGQVDMFDLGGCGCFVDIEE